MEIYIFKHYDINKNVYKKVRSRQLSCISMQHKFLIYDKLLLSIWICMCVLVYILFMVALTQITLTSLKSYISINLYIIKSICIKQKFTTIYTSTHKNISRPSYSYVSASQWSYMESMFREISNLTPYLLFIYIDKF